jgi:hypothetical protein
MHCGKCNKKLNYDILRGFIVEKAVESQWARAVPSPGFAEEICPACLTAVVYGGLPKQGFGNRLKNYLKA